MMICCDMLHRDLHYNRHGEIETNVWAKDTLPNLSAIDVMVDSPSKDKSASEIICHFIKKQSKTKQKQTNK